jgi:putative transposase
MPITYKFRLYPNQEQEGKLIWTLERCRLIYNDMLFRLDEQDRSDRLVLQSMLPKLKESNPELKDVYSKVLQYEIYRLFSNLKAVSQLKKKGKKVGRLRPKGKGWFKTFTYNQSGFKFIVTGKRLDRLHLSKIGDIQIKIHRQIKGNIKQITVKRYDSGKWYACISVDNNRMDKRSVRRVVGIDMGITHFITDSNGIQVENPIYLKKALKQLNCRQRRLSKMKKGSRNRHKQRARVARLHEKIVNQRNDFLHKLSRYYVNNYDFIAIENLNIKNLVKNHRLANRISDVSWSRFASMVSYKAESAGKILVKVNPRGTSREYKYGDLDRDYNASLNILQRGLEQVGKGQTEFTPVDIRPLQELVTIPASQVVESGSLLQN